MPIKLKRSAVAGKAPQTTDLDLGELAVNTHDGRLYLKKNAGADTIVEVTGVKSHAMLSPLAGIFATKTDPC